MKLTWHIIKKDIRHNAWALGLWVLLFVAQIGLGLVLLHEADADIGWVSQMQLGSTLLVFLQFATGYILVARFVQADEITGTRMFWATRPISATRLLVAKALGVLLIFALLPVLLLLPWWLYNGFGPREIAWSAVETLGWQLLMIAPAFLIAALTDDLGRALMWTLVLIMGLVAWTIWVQSDLKTALGGPAYSKNSGLLFTRLWLAGAILVIGTLRIAAHQFLTRRFVPSLVAAGFVLGLIALVGWAWPWDGSELFAPANEPEPELTAAAGSFAEVQLAVGPARILDWGNPSIRTQEASAYILEHLEARGVPEELMINGVAAAQIWRWPEGQAVSNDSRRFYSASGDRVLRKALALPAPPDDPETRRWQQERRDREKANRIAPGPTPRPRAADSVMLRGYARLPVSLITRIREQPPAYETEFEVVLSRQKIVFELPLKPGTRGSEGAQTFRIVNWTHEPDDNPDPALRVNRATARMVATTPAVKGNGVWLWKTIDPRTRNYSPFPEEFLVLNRTAGNYEAPDLRRGARGATPDRVRVGGVGIHWCTFGVTPDRVIRSGRWVDRDPDWFDHITWVLMAEQPVARFTRGVKTEKFELEPSALEKAKAEAAQGKPNGTL